jgi:hypothetical protein
MTHMTRGGVGGGEKQMHNVDYDPGPWRQTLSLPPPGIEPQVHNVESHNLLEI